MSGRECRQRQLDGLSQGLRVQSARLLKQGLPPLALKQLQVWMAACPLPQPWALRQRTELTPVWARVPPQALASRSVLVLLIGLVPLWELVQLLGSMTVQALVTLLKLAWLLASFVWLLGSGRPFVRIPPRELTLEWLPV